MINKKAFTLVELIVSIAILTLLGTIGFNSYSSFVNYSRDSSRISEVSNMNTSVNSFFMKNSYYPTPSDGEDVTYSGATVWTQGIFGHSVVEKLPEINSVPMYPLNGKFYTYSVLNNKKEYQIATIQETGDFSYNNIIKETNASSSNAYAYVVGNFNGLISQARVNNIDYIFSTPSIITTQIDDIRNIISNNYFVLNSLSNLPSNYKSAKLNINGNNGGNLLNHSTYNPIVFSGCISDIKYNKEIDIQKTLIDDIQDLYSSTDIEDNKKIKNLLVQNTTINDFKLEYFTKKLISKLTIVPGCSTEVTPPIPPVIPTGWMLEDSNCTIPDITIGTQTWAGCNSTLGTRIDYNGTNTCSDYVGGTYSNSGCGGSETIESDYDSTYGRDTIWGGLYNWSSIGSACNTGYKVPTDAEFATMINTISGTSCMPTKSAGVECTLYGWDKPSNTSNNIVGVRLNMPLSGYIYNNNSHNCGAKSYFWTTDSQGQKGWAFVFNRDINQPISQTILDKDNGYSVRCIKDI